eukprot:2554928-Amphidinium_carterae.1
MHPAPGGGSGPKTQPSWRDCYTAPRCVQQPAWCQIARAINDAEDYNANKNYDILNSVQELLCNQ